MPWGRVLAVWLLITGAETLHGIARTLWLVPRVGDLSSRQIGVFSGSLIIFAITWLTIGWLGIRRTRALLLAGAVWVVLMLAFEFVLGRAVFGFGWDRIVAEFDLSRGGLMGFGLAALLLMPLFAARLRGLAIPDRPR
jgi:hypothetical protein